MTDKEAIKELRDCRWLQLEAVLLELEIIRTRRRIDAAAALEADYMPKMTAILREQEQLLIDARKRRIDLITTIEDRIALVPDRRERELLQIIFIDGQTKKQSAEHFSLTERWISELLRRAVESYRAAGSDPVAAAG